MDGASPGAADAQLVGDRYELRESLGEGGMGRVYRGFDRHLQRLVAVKMTDRGISARWMREARAMARLSHVNIAAIYDVGDGAAKFIAMELVEGLALGDAWKEWPLRKKVEALRRIASAVAYAHEHGVLHRDLKPANVMVTHGGAVKLIDFGLAVVDGEVTVTREGTVLGTPAYMAPEQVRGEGAMTATDVYSLGVLLYEALGGAPPFHQGTLPEVYQAILLKEPPVLRAVDRDLLALAMKCLSKRPEERLSGAAALGAELQHWLDGEPMATRGPGTMSRAAGWARSHPGLATSGAVAAAVLLIAASAWGWVTTERRARADLLVVQSLAAPDAASARASAEAAVRLAPSSGSARRALARAKLREYLGRRGLPPAMISRGAVILLPPPRETPELAALRREIEEGGAGDALVEGALAAWAGRPQDALALLPTEPVEAQVLRAHCLYLLGRFLEAADVLKPAIQTRPREVLPLWGELMIALALEHGGEQWPRRVQEAGAALAVAGDEEGGRVLRARGLIDRAALVLSRGDEPVLAEAFRLLEGLTSAGASLARADALSMRAEWLAQRGQLEPWDPAEFREALEEYGRSLELATARLRRAACRRARAAWEGSFLRSRPGEAEAIRDDYAAAGSHPEALLGLAGDDVESVTRIIDVHPRYAPAYLARAAARHALANKSGKEPAAIVHLVAAVADCDEALRLAPSAAALIQRCGIRIAIAMKQADPAAGLAEFRHARADVEEILTREPRNENAHAMLIAALWTEGVYRTERKLDPKEALLQGVERATLAVERLPNLADVRRRRATMLRDYSFHIESPEEKLLILRDAIQELDRALALNPKLCDALRVRAMIHRRIGVAGHDPETEFAAGLKDLEAAFAIDPPLREKGSHFHQERAVILLEQGRHRELKGGDAPASFRAARQAAETAVAIDPKNADNRKLLGRALAALADHAPEAEARPLYTQSIQEYDRILTENEGHPTVPRWKEERERVVDSMKRRGFSQR